MSEVWYHVEYDQIFLLEHMLNPNWKWVEFYNSGPRWVTIHDSLFWYAIKIGEL